ncbi:MAG: hypothetical protein V1773_17520 [bacterium]
MKFFVKNTNKTSEQWYIHVVLYTIIIILSYILINVAFIQPNKIVLREKYYKKESRLRMLNLREAEILFKEKYGSFTDNIDSLIGFLKYDKLVTASISKIDPVTKKSLSPFKNLTKFVFAPQIYDSLRHAPKSLRPYKITIDTLSTGSTTVKGTNYLIECPDGYGKIGDLFNETLKNTASWE